MLNVAGSMSTKTGVAPHSSITLAVATHEYGATMTRSPGPMPRRQQADSQRSGAVADRHCVGTPTCSATSRSNSATRAPCTRYPESSTARDRRQLRVAHDGPGDRNRMPHTPSCVRTNAAVAAIPSSRSTSASKPSSSRALRRPPARAARRRRSPCGRTTSSTSSRVTRTTVFGQAVDRRHRPLVADVERLADGRWDASSASSTPRDHVVDVAPGPDLRAVAVDLDRLVPHGALR